MATIQLGDNEERVLSKKYPSNSNVPKKKPDGEKPKINPIVTSGVRRRKTPLSKKFSKAFFNEDVGSIGSYVLNDIILPGAKQIIYDIAMNSLGMSLFGQAMPKNIGRHGSSSGITNYSSRGSSSRGSSRTISSRDRSTHKFDDIVLDSKWDAEEVLSKMGWLLDEYGQVTVADMYDLLSISQTHADRNYGWTNLSSASVERIPQGGYVLVLPRTEVMK